MQRIKLIDEDGDQVEFTLRSDGSLEIETDSAELPKVAVVFLSYSQTKELAAWFERLPI